MDILKRRQSYLRQGFTEEQVDALVGVETPAEPPKAKVEPVETPDQEPTTEKAPKTKSAKMKSK